MNHHQVSEYYPAVSERLSNILDNIGYSREDRDRKVRIATEVEVMRNMDMTLRKRGLRVYMFGSRGEGSTGPGLQSDQDFLLQLEDMTVVTDLTNYQPDKTNYIMVNDDLTHPGYVKLQRITISPDFTLYPMYHEESIHENCTHDSLNRCLLSNEMSYGDGILSGPALRFESKDKRVSTDTDTVTAFRSSQCPRELYERFQRRRLYRWPTPEQIKAAIGYGCFVTPVGHPHSTEQHIEWRLSFSIAEREFMRSFEDTAMKVYTLLKMIKKTYIEPFVGDAFSSYHCKVCMLWMRERIARELWNDENLLYCLILCIRQLYEWATSGFCPDYFIVKNNIYDRKIDGTVREYLVQILRWLLSTDSRFLLQIKCCYLGQLLTNGINGVNLLRRSITPLIVQEASVDYTVMISSASSFRYAILKQIPQSHPTLVDYLQRIMYASKHFTYIVKYPLKYAMMFLWSQLGFHIATVCKENACFLSREEVDYLVSLASGCLSFGINSDATSVRLKLCGLGMELGNYDLTEACLQRINEYRMRIMYSVTVDYEIYAALWNCNSRSYVEKCCTKRFSTQELLQNQVSFSVFYLPSEISITPKPLRMEMFRSFGAPPKLTDIFEKSWYDWCMVDSLMCLYFFQYLNFSRQGKERHKQAAMDNMIHVIRTEPKILHRDTALNLLGYSFMQANQISNAFLCFSQSLKVRPYHNAAKFYLGLLFKRVLATHRRHVPYGSRTMDIVSKSSNVQYDNKFHFMTC